MSEQRTAKAGQIQVEQAALSDGIGWKPYPRHDNDPDSNSEVIPEVAVIAQGKPQADAELFYCDGASTLATLMSDPISRREVCRDCWNGLHGTRKHPGCKLPTCRCACRDAAEEQRRERLAHAAARRERQVLERGQLQSEDNPLRAFNPSYREPWRAEAAKDMKRNSRSNRKHERQGSDFVGG